MLTTPGDPRGVEKHYWNNGANENQQLNPGGPSNKTNKQKTNSKTCFFSFFFFLFFFLLIICLGLLNLDLLQSFATVLVLRYGFKVTLRVTATVTLSQIVLIFVSNTSQLIGLVNFIITDWTYLVIWNKIGIGSSVAFLKSFSTFLCIYNLMTAQLKAFRLRYGELFCFNHVLVLISVALEYARLGDIGWILAMILKFIGCMIFSFVRQWNKLFKSKNITHYMNHTWLGFINFVHEQ